VRIPKFWYKVEKDESASKMRFYVSGEARVGLSVHPAFDRGDGSGERDYIYVGKYNTGPGYVTKLAYKPLVGMTRSAARTGSHNKGASWWQYDYATWSAIWLLYLVEFANWDSQAQIGMGYVDNSNTASIDTGGCDSMVYHTGRAAGTDGKTAVMYRWIENLWGNVHEWCDGFNTYHGLVYICLDPAKFSENTATNYISTDIKLSSGSTIKYIGFSETFPFAFIPSSGSISAKTPIPDYCGSSNGWCVLMLGGQWNYNDMGGLFCLNASVSATSAGPYAGSRLMFLP
jgi:hypothetical protein